MPLNPQTAPASPTLPTHAEVNPWMVLLAISCGLVVANIY
jgi:hypothetical protein